MSALWRYFCVVKRRWTIDKNKVGWKMLYGVKKSVVLLVSVVTLLATSVVLQGVIVWQLSVGSQFPPGVAPIPVEIVNERDIGVKVNNRRDIGVEVNNTSDIGVEVNNTSDIDVNVRDHYITKGDPIPVRIVR